MYWDGIFNVFSVFYDCEKCVWVLMWIECFVVIFYGLYGKVVSGEYVVCLLISFYYWVFLVVISMFSNISFFNIW